jgi:hypothetical protein
MSDTPLISEQHAAMESGRHVLLCPGLEITDGALPMATRLVGYPTYHFHAKNGSGNYRWMLTSGLLPVGLVWHEDGRITGMPTEYNFSTGSGPVAVRNYDFAVEVWDLTSHERAHKAFRLSVMPAVRIQGSLSVPISGWAYAPTPWTFDYVQVSSLGTVFPPDPRYFGRAYNLVAITGFPLLQAYVGLHHEDDGGWKAYAGYPCTVYEDGPGWVSEAGFYGGSQPGPLGTYVVPLREIYTSYYGEWAPVPDGWPPANIVVS